MICPESSRRLDESLASQKHFLDAHTRKLKVSPKETPCACTNPAFTSSTNMELAVGMYTGQYCGEQGRRFSSMKMTLRFESNQIMSSENRMPFIQKPQGDSRWKTKSIPRSGDIDSRPDSPRSWSDGVLASSTFNTTPRITIITVLGGLSRTKPMENVAAMRTTKAATISLFSLKPPSNSSTVSRRSLLY